MLAHKLLYQPACFDNHCEITVFPRNLAAARFYFEAPFGAATIRGRLDFEGGVYRDRYARTYTASIISLVVCT